MSDPVFLSLEQVASLHRISLELHGGQEGLRDESAFEGAVFQPQNIWHYAQGDLFDVAAAYAYHLSQSQAFIDGNKRTGMSAALVFLRMNGVTISQNSEALHAAMIAIAEHRMNRMGLAALFRRCPG